MISKNQTLNFVSLDLPAEGYENDNFNDTGNDESNTCRPKPEEKLNEKPAKNENLEVVERKYHLVIFIFSVTRRSRSDSRQLLTYSLTHWLTKR